MSVMLAPHLALFTGGMVIPVFIDGSETEFREVESLMPATQQKWERSWPAPGPSFNLKGIKVIMTASLASTR